MITPTILSPLCYVIFSALPNSWTTTPIFKLCIHLDLDYTLQTFMIASFTVVMTSCKRDDKLSPRPRCALDESHSHPVTLWWEGKVEFTLSPTGLNTSTPAAVFSSAQSSLLSRYGETKVPRQTEIMTPLLLSHTIYGHPRLVNKNNVYFSVSRVCVCCGVGACWSLCVQDAWEEKIH